MSKISPGWLFFYSLATKYYEYYGDLDVPSTFKTRNGYEKVRENEEGIFDLGQWIARQRFGNIENDHYNLTNKKRELLNKIEMIWDANEYRWDKLYQLAKKYYEHYGHLDVSGTFKTKNGYEEDAKGFPLGQWMKYQRSNFKGNDFSCLSDEKIEKLNKIEMIWDVNECKWIRMYELAKKYYEHYGHLNVSRTFRTKNGYDEDDNGLPLGQWVHTQRRRYRGELKVDLTDKQLSLLEKLNIIWFIRNKDQCQKELITSSNNFRKKREIYNRFRSFLNGISNHNTLSKEEINEMFINQLNNKIQKEKRRSNDLKVNCLDEAVYETLKDYGYENLTERLKILIYCMILHIDKMDQDQDAYLAFTEKNGAREYIQSKGKDALIDEMKQLLLLDHKNVESIEDIYQEYASSFYHRKCDNQKVNCLENALYETIKDYGYDKFSDRLELLIYCLVEHIDRADQYEEAWLAFTKKNGAREYIQSKGKDALIDEMKQLLLLDHKNIESIEDIYQEYASSFYHKKYDNTQFQKKKKS